MPEIFLDKPKPNLENELTLLKEDAISFAKSLEKLSAHSDIKSAKNIIMSLVSHINLTYNTRFGLEDILATNRQNTIAQHNKALANSEKELAKKIELEPIKI